MVPKTGAANASTVLYEDGTWDTKLFTNTSAGMVPSPALGAGTNVLQASGTWKSLGTVLTLTDQSAVMPSSAILQAGTGLAFGPGASTLRARARRWAATPNVPLANHATGITEIDAPLFPIYHDDFSLSTYFTIGVLNLQMQLTGTGDVSITTQVPDNIDTPGSGFNIPISGTCTGTKIVTPFNTFLTSVVQDTTTARLSFGFPTGAITTAAGQFVVRCNLMFISSALLGAANS
jgi:hypothetical protein